MHGAGKHKDGGLRLFTSGHLKEMQFFEDHSSPNTLVRAEVYASMQTSAVYTVRLAIDKASGNICSGSCKCKAGTIGVCKHVCCCLYALAHITTHELKSVPEAKSCTEGSREWYTPRNPKVVSQSIGALDFVKDTTERLSSVPEHYAKKRRYSCLQEDRRVISSEQLNSIQGSCRQVGLDCLADVIQSHACRPATLATSLEQNSRLPRTWLELFRETGMLSTYSLEEAAEIELVTRGQSKCDLWSKYRTGMVTASITHRVFTWVKTIDSKPRPHNVGPLLRGILSKQSIQTSAMKRGIDMEPIAKGRYIEEHGNKHRNLHIVEHGFCVLPGCPFIGASPDGVTECDCCEREVLEVKCPLSIKKFIDQHLREQTLKKTSQCYTQMQLQMGATHTNSGVLLIYHPDERPVEVSVEFDKGYYLSVVKLLRHFYTEFVAPCLCSP
ncbi:uncharacterized protein LOC135389484 [Ornithodoros turicata]|uniref:uncharacterized protein LOC135389484 n=1 Tax=Ornithodoros turicata TaxID=34597 RepID=UPI003139E4C5